MQRFRCLACRGTFSVQTFRMDYRDHRPGVNGALLQRIAAGHGLRQCSRSLGLSLRATELKLRKLAAHLERLARNLRMRGAQRRDPRAVRLAERRGAKLAMARAAILRALEAPDLAPSQPGRGVLLTWRQDWGRRSVHPRSRTGTRVDRWHPRAPAERRSRSEMRSRSGSSWRPRSAPPTASSGCARGTDPRTRARSAARAG